MSDILSIDFETRSRVELKKCGPYAYAEDDSTSVLCMAWAFNDEEPEIWTPSMKPEPGVRTFGVWPERILRHIHDGGIIRGWNVNFERLMWNNIMTKRHAWPTVKGEQWVDTAAEAAAMALPRSLDEAAYVLGVKHQKDKAGHALMMKLCKPRKVLADGTVIWWPDTDLPALFDYCKQDVRAERSVAAAMRRLGEKEQAVFYMDMRMNDRGVAVDLPLVRAAQAIVDRSIAEANADLDRLTEGGVSAITNHGRLTQWLRSQGVETDGVSKVRVHELLQREDLAETVRRALQLRADVGRSSVAKLRSMELAACRDGRLRGLHLYHGASTGRWSGKLVQPQNFPRGEIKGAESFIPDILAGNYEWVNLAAPPVVVVLSLLRSMLRAPEGKVLYAGDFSAIEARVLNWLAGETDVTDSFRLYDAGDKSQDPYKRMAVRMGRATTLADVTYDDRQAGKAAELGCGYQMGAEKFQTAAWDVYRVAVTPEQAQQAVGAYRESHPHVKQLWWDTERACLDAVRDPGTVHRVGAGNQVKITCRGGYLYVVLPSGRPLCYARPKVVTVETPWSVKARKKWLADRDAYNANQALITRAEYIGGTDFPTVPDPGPEPQPQMKDQVEFSAVDSYTRKWSRQRAYGGLWVENIVQAISRDLLAESMLRVEAAGYAPILSVHDEVVCERAEGSGDLAEFTKLLAQTPDWATDCPVSAEAWTGVRYRK